MEWEQGLEDRDGGGREKRRDRGWDKEVPTEAAPETGQGQDRVQAGEMAVEEVLRRDQDSLQDSSPPPERAQGLIRGMLRIPNLPIHRKPGPEGTREKSC